MARMVTDKSAMYKVHGKYLQYLVVFDDFDDTYSVVKCYNQKQTFIGSSYKTRKGAVRKYENLVSSIVADHISE